MAKTKSKSELSVIVQLSEGMSMAFKSDLSRLSDYQSFKLKDFFVSVLTRSKKPKELIREVSSYPYVRRVAYSSRAYPVEGNRNYEGL